MHSGDTQAAMNKIHLKQRRMLGRIAWGLAAILAAGSALGWALPKRTSKKPDKQDLVTALDIIVTAGPANAPVANASVYVRYDQPRFLRRPERIELDLKTDLKGVTKVTGVPQGKVVVQVVKSGWRPFGEYYVLDKAKQTIKIKLKSPPHWY